MPLSHPVSYRAIYQRSINKDRCIEGWDNPTYPVLSLSLRLHTDYSPFLKLPPFNSININVVPHPVLSMSIIFYIELYIEDR